MLRPYQQDALAALNDYLSIEKGNPLVVIPTGGGKTHVISAFCQLHRHSRILILSHVKEILRQDYSTLGQYLNEPIGLISKGMDSRSIERVTVAGIQSIYKEEMDVDYVIVDEAHLIPPSGEGRYRTFLAKHNWCPVIGFTATPFRRSHGLLTENHIFNKIVYEASIVELIKQGYLCPIQSKSTSYRMDTKNLRVQAGDFVKKDLKQFDKEELNKIIVEQLTPYKDSHKKWLVFAIDIEHCEHIAKELIRNGIRAFAVHSKMDRDLPLQFFKENHVQAVVSVETLTTGFDDPEVDLIVLLRPTTSPVLHCQMIGRGLRIAPAKKGCLVLDFADNIGRLGPINALTIDSIKERKGKKKKKRPTKVCPSCHEILPIQSTLCPVCAYEFPVKEKLLKQATGKAVLLDKQWIHVDNMEIKQSKKLGKLPNLMIKFHTNMGVVSDWKCFDHDGYPKMLAQKWWKGFVGTKTPLSVQEAYERKEEIPVPSRILVEKEGRWTKVKLYSR